MGNSSSQIDVANAQSDTGRRAPRYTPTMDDVAALQQLNQELSLRNKTGSDEELLSKPTAKTPPQKKRILPSIGQDGPLESKRSRQEVHGIPGENEELPEIIAPLEGSSSPHILPQEIQDNIETDDASVAVEGPSLFVGSFEDDSPINEVTDWQPPVQDTAYTMSPPTVSSPPTTRDQIVRKPSRTQRSQSKEQTRSNDEMEEDTTQLILRAQKVQRASKRRRTSHSDPHEDHVVNTEVEENSAHAVPRNQRQRRASAKIKRFLVDDHDESLLDVGTKNNSAHIAPGDRRSCRLLDKSRMAVVDHDDDQVPNDQILEIPLRKIPRPRRSRKALEESNHESIASHLDDLSHNEVEENYEHTSLRTRASRRASGNGNKNDTGSHKDNVSGDEIVDTHVNTNAHPQISRNTSHDANHEPINRHEDGVSVSEVEENYGHTALHTRRSRRRSGKKPSNYYEKDPFLDETEDDPAPTVDDPASTHAWPTGNRTHRRKSYCSPESSFKTKSLLPPTQEELDTRYTSGSGSSNLLRKQSFVQSQKKKSLRRIRSQPKSTGSLASAFQMWTPPSTIRSSSSVQLSNSFPLPDRNIFVKSQFTTLQPQSNDEAGSEDVRPIGNAEPERRKGICESQRQEPLVCDNEESPWVAVSFPSTREVLESDYVNQDGHEAATEQDVDLESSHDDEVPTKLADLALTDERTLHHPPDKRTNGPLTSDEKELIRRALRSFMERKDLETAELLEIIHWPIGRSRKTTSDHHQGLDSNSDELWRDIKDQGLLRNDKIIRQYVRSKFHAYKTGPWTPEEDSELESLYHLYQGVWADISTVMETRSASGCRSRYRNLAESRVKPIVLSQLQDDKDCGPKWSFQIVSMGPPQKKSRIEPQPAETIQLKPGRISKTQKLRESAKTSKRREQTEQREQPVESGSDAEGISSRPVLEDDADTSEFDSWIMETVPPIFVTDAPDSNQMQISDKLNLIMTIAEREYKDEVDVAWSDLAAAAKHTWSTRTLQTAFNDLLDEHKGRVTEAMTFLDRLIEIIEYLTTTFPEELQDDHDPFSNEISQEVAPTIWKVTPNTGKKRKRSSRATSIAAQKKFKSQEIIDDSD